MKKETRLAALCCAALVFAGCGEEEAGSSGRGRPGGWGGAPRRAAAVPVKAEAVQRADMVAYIETHARLEAERRVVVVSRATGLVQELLVEEGQRVRRGDVLARLDKSELALNVERVKVNLDQARTSLKRNEALYRRNMVSEADFESVRNQVDNLQVQLREAQLSLEYADIRSPIDGLVMERQVELGDMARGNGELFVVADLSPLLTRIYIPERRMRQISPGQEARIHIDALPDSSFGARIRMISPGVDPQSGTVKVTLEIPAGGGVLRPGMFATVRIITQRRPGTLAIPKKALVLETDEDDAFVVVEGEPAAADGMRGRGGRPGSDAAAAPEGRGKPESRGGRPEGKPDGGRGEGGGTGGGESAAAPGYQVKRASLQLGLVQGDLVEVLGGLEEGDLVVTIGHEGLKEGTAVRLIDTGGTAPSDGAPNPDGKKGRAEGLAAGGRAGADAKPAGQWGDRAGAKGKGRPAGTESSAGGKQRPAGG